MARVAAGDEVNLKAYRNTLQVTVLDGTVLGKVERGLAERLIRLIKSGNKYQAGVVMAEPARLRILVRETVQAPQNEGRISFPPRTASVRAYTRETLLRRAGGDDEDLEVDASDVEAQDIDDEDENPAEFGFSETSLAGERETT